MAATFVMMETTNEIDYKYSYKYSTRIWTCYELLNLSVKPEIHMMVIMKIIVIRVVTTCNLGDRQITCLPNYMMLQLKDSNQYI
jgi:hypothetical protein